MNRPTFWFLAGAPAALALVCGLSIVAHLGSALAPARRVSCADLLEDGLAVWADRELGSLAPTTRLVAEGCTVDLRWSLRTGPEGSFGAGNGPWEVFDGDGEATAWVTATPSSPADPGAETRQTAGFQWLTEDPESVALVRHVRAHQSGNRVERTLRRHRELYVQEGRQLRGVLRKGAGHAGGWILDGRSAPGWMPFFQAWPFGLLGLATWFWVVGMQRRWTASARRARGHSWDERLEPTTF
ncbi:MAG TPA: hypothetical protein RMF84_19045 [Polyangiaceae bacterium LLY-WYZ-14_1]|nr:hypothetical protein [Polyangiaceae bacterium LLY-WYZ-14_1]